MGIDRLIAGCLGLLLILGWPGMAQAGPLQPDDGDRCLLAVQQERYEKAIASCSQVIEQEPTDAADYRLSRGLAFYRSGYFAEAIADNTQVLATHPDDYRAYYNRGLVHIALHDFAAAIADFDQAAKFASEPMSLSDIYDDRGLAKLMAAQPEAALRDFDQALAFNSDDTRALFNHGCACHQLGRVNDALADLNQVLNLEPDHARTYLKRGVLRQALGDRTGSLADLRQAADCAQAQGQPYLHHYVLTLLNEWQTPSTLLG
ncbi:tetratricopeptide repeat protein [Nodosilinea sp. LEGE 07088]|uniref:tetratricopeptide repeat protein n=1 Tax=Nodosilinea sp. LEGE 07088 TaxID=2777968 RepID=UPI001881FD73|nr:tetratricopeptide repeat protein [Nodosilinea sp. LEGE 07088]MBE9136802.1 tetratricopeptide repeat protein [Nodosilinea sp. LEGE 07088]